MTQPSLNLVLVHTRGAQDVADFHEIGRMVSEIAPDIEVFIAENMQSSAYTRKKAAQRPTLIVSPMQLIKFRPERGKIYCGRPMSKLEEMRCLLAGGAPVPAFTALGPDTLLDPAVYGPLVIVKPSYAFASFGQGVELVRVGDVAYKPPQDYPEGHPGRRAPMIAQRFIDCGRPMSCRVLTFFGEPILTYLRQSTRDFADVAARPTFEQADFLPSWPDIEISSTTDAEFLSLARAAYAAIPDVPLQACDILRGKDGQVHLLEINPGGATWMFSNSSAPGFRKMLQVDDLTAEFNAFRTCARLLVERTRKEAV